ncbi:hypothetical protein AYI68_g3679 [Smittium mucronatum]|uniref:Uncharacterized protein n=1 Tax=Smittium mucronatum TaxID=133383 RepID=A0A1R0GZ91_9FUNG|nr:hypothetical protein AYI68_g3679 [Smittium mucronatum]
MKTEQVLGSETFKGKAESSLDKILKYLHTNKLDNHQIDSIYRYFLDLTSCFQDSNNLSNEVTNSAIQYIPYKSLLQIRDSIYSKFPNLEISESLVLLKALKDTFLKSKKFQFISFKSLIEKFNSFGKLVSLEKYPL